ncbi:hypothetical protein [Nocardia huaxiensis]|uniref:hypothetical protein n=1 Tax=Nocardia huaxiensis TaxID=2755382 RepID=UPI001E52C7BB|nr:hypothetical protein [Nocardia huaxiensis]UFS93404.1 hypothetical protein LPY97_21485 [Nocardia huaxiensis]
MAATSTGVYPDAPHSDTGLLDQALTTVTEGRYPAELFLMDGDTDRIEVTGRAWSDFGRAARDAGYRIAGLDTSRFLGLEAGLFTGVKDDHLAQRLQITGEAYTRAGDALQQYAIELTRLQTNMEPVAAEAPHTYEQLQAAVAAVRTSNVLTVGAALDELGRVRARWDSLVTTATDLQRDLNRMVEATIIDIRSATVLRFSENPIGEQAFAIIGRGVNGLLDRPLNPVAANTEPIRTLASGSDALSEVAGFASTAAILPPLTAAAAPLTAAAVAAGTVSAAAAKTSAGVGDWRRILLRAGLDVIPLAKPARLAYRVAGITGLAPTDDLVDLVVPENTPGGGTHARELFEASLNPAVVPDPDAAETTEKRFTASRFGTGELTSLTGPAPVGAPFVLRIPARLNNRPQPRDSQGDDNGRHNHTGAIGDRLRLVLDPGSGYEQLTVPTGSGGERTLVLINNAGAPIRYQFTQPVPEGGRLQPNPDGSVSILARDGDTAGHIKRPWAYDALGREVATDYTVDGDTLTQTIHATKDSVFPILADPEGEAPAAPDPDPAPPAAQPVSDPQQMDPEVAKMLPGLGGALNSDGTVKSPEQVDADRTARETLNQLPGVQAPAPTSPLDMVPAVDQTMAATGPSGQQQPTVTDFVDRAAKGDMKDGESYELPSGAGTVTQTGEPGRDPGTTIHTEKWDLKNGESLEVKSGTVKYDTPHPELGGSGWTAEVGPNGKPTHIDITDGKVASISYDITGKPSSVTFPDGSIFSLNDKGKIEGSFQDPVHGISGTAEPLANGGTRLTFSNGEKVDVNTRGELSNHQAAPDLRSNMEKVGDFFSNAGNSLADWGSDVAAGFRYGDGLRAAANPLDQAAAAAATENSQRLTGAVADAGNFALHAVVDPITDIGSFLTHYAQAGMTGLTGAAAGGPLTPTGQQLSDAALEEMEAAPSVPRIALDLATFLPIPGIAGIRAGLAELRGLGSAATRGALEATDDIARGWSGLPEGVPGSSKPIDLQGPPLSGVGAHPPLNKPFDPNTMPNFDELRFSPSEIGHGTNYPGAGAAVAKAGSTDAAADALRISELETQGHSPQRHLHPTDGQLQSRLGTPQLTGNPPHPNFQDGYVVSSGKIDPAKGPVELLTRDRYMDKYATNNAGDPIKHKCGPFSTAFGDQRSLVAAEAAARNQIPVGSTAPREVVQLTPEQVRAAIGDEGIAKLRGFYIDPANPMTGTRVNYKPVDFTDTKILAVYDRTPTGDWNLTTMYPEPQKRLNP